MSEVTDTDPPVGSIVYGAPIEQQEASEVEASRIPRYPETTSPAVNPEPGSYVTGAAPLSKPVGTLEDVGRSVAAQGTLGLTADLPTTGQFLGEKYKNLTDKATDYAISKINPENPDKWKQVLGTASMMNPIYSGATVMGNLFPNFTQEGFQKKIQELLPFTKYEPQGTTAKTLGAGARVAAPAVAEALVSGGLAPAAEGATFLSKLLSTLKGTVRPAVTSTVAGGTSELAGEAVHNAFPDSPNAEMVARLATAFGGHYVADKAMNAVSALTLPNATSEEKVLRALQDDFKTDPNLLKRYQDAVANGQNPTIYDIGGPQTSSLLKKYGYLNDEAKAKVGKLTTAIAARSDNAVQNVTNHVDSLYGDLGADKIQRITDKLNKDKTDAIYGLARNNPSANQIWNPELEELMSHPWMQTSIKEAETNSVVPRLNIKPYKPSTPDTVAQLPNLNFWHAVKTNLDEQIGKALRSGDKTLASNMIEDKNALLKQMDNAVPDYANARDAASERFGATNAIEAGHKAASKMDVFEAGEFEKNYNALNPQQRDLFAQGAASWIRDTLANSPNGINALISQFSKPGVAKRMTMALGEDNFHSIFGKAATEKLLASTDIPASPKNYFPSGLKTSSGVAIGGLGPLAIYDMARNASPTLTQLGFILGGSVAPLLHRGLINFSEHRIAPRVIDLISDPSKTAELGALLAKNSDAQSFLEKSGRLLASATMRGRSALPSQYPPAPNPLMAPIVEKGNLNQDTEGEPLSVRNNNMGNLKDSKWTRNQRGYTGVKDGFASFDTPENGRIAAQNLLTNKISAGLNTPRKLIETQGKGWDPSASPEYAQSIARALKIGVDDPFDTKDPTVVAKILDSIRTMEGVPKNHAAGGRIGRASGGRIDHAKHDMLVNRLMTMAKRAKKGADAATEPLLNAPDESIVKALNVAQQAI